MVVATVPNGSLAVRLRSRLIARRPLAQVVFPVFWRLEEQYSAAIANLPVLGRGTALARWVGRRSRPKAAPDHWESKVIEKVEHGFANGQKLGRHHEFAIHDGCVVD